MILLSKKRRAESGEGKVPVKCTELVQDKDDLLQIFDIHRAERDKNTYSIRRLHTFANSVQMKFLRMLEAAIDYKNYKLAAFALSNPPKGCFYIFGLFKPSDNTPSMVLVSVKAIEVTGLDRFVIDEA
jgi:hypothetical protein